MTNQTANTNRPASPASIARQAFVAEQVALIKASGHSMTSRWVNAVIRAGEAFSAGKQARAEMTAKCEAYNTSITSCECEAGKNGMPCKHRAFQRLMQKWTQGA